MPKIDPTRWRELSPFLDELLALADEERAARLDSLRATQPGLAEELRALLANLAGLEQEGFLEGDVSHMLGQPSLAGHKLGAYTLEAAIGHGGMGSVWLARRSDGRFEGNVAIKLLNIALVGRGGEERFRREGRVLARLTHPNIARLIDAGVTATVQPYLVLEYVKGSGIDRYCDGHGLSVEARINLFLDVLAAVGHAHVNLIVHRDIKPSNIYVTHDGRVKLLDFGIAKLIEDEEQPDSVTNLTREGARVLTPDYAAPEQALGEPITIATDIYALGVLLYVLLCGQHPTGEQDASALQHIRLLLETEPPRLSDAATGSRTSDRTTLEQNAANRALNTPLKLKRALRGDLDNIVAKALKKSPQERYASVQEFADDLRRFLRNEPVLARADNSWYRLRKFVRRNRLPVAIGGAALVAVLATAAIALWEAQAAKVERDRALAVSSRNEAVADFLNMLITEGAEADKPVTVSDMLTRSETLVRAQFRNAPEQRAAVLDMLGMYYYGIGKDSRAEPLLREAMETIRTSADGDLRRKLTCDHAATLGKLGKVPEAIGMLHAVLAEPQITAQESAECLGDLASAAQLSDDTANAAKFAKLALERLHQVPHPSPILEGTFIENVGYAEYLDGHNDIAVQYYERALAQFARVGRDHGLDALSVQNDLGSLHEATGNPRLGLEQFEQAIRISRQVDPTAPPSPYLVGNRGAALEHLGRFQEAREAYTECLKLTRQMGTPVGQAHCLLGLASVSFDLADLASANSYADSASALISSATNSDRGVADSLQYVRGMIALAAGRLVQARVSLDAAISDGKGIHLTMKALLARSELNLLEDKAAAAQADAQRSLDLARTAQGSVPYSCRTGLGWLSLGLVRAKKGELEQARAAFREAVAHLSNTVDFDYPPLVRARQLASD